MRRTPEAASEYRLDPTLDFMRLLWSIEHGLHKRSKRMKAEIGLTGPQRLVLRIVSRFPGLSAGELARIAQGMRFIDTATDLAHDALADVHQLCIVAEADGR